MKDAFTAPNVAKASFTTPPRRRGRPGHDLPTVLEAAARLFYERGYDGTSMDELARRLGVTKSAIYHHVASKEELLRLIVDRALDGLFAVAEQAQRLDGRAIDALEQLVRGSIAVLAAELPFVTVLLRVRGNSEVEREALARRRRFDRIVAALVQRAEAEGDIRTDIDPATTAKLLFGTVNSLIDWYRPDRGLPPTAVADAIVGTAFTGIRTRP